MSSYDKKRKMSQGSGEGEVAGEAKEEEERKPECSPDSGPEGSGFFLVLRPIPLSSGTEIG